MKKLTVAFVGCGNFARHFVSLFKVHPFVQKVYVCDLIEEKATEYSKKFVNSFNLVETMSKFK